MKNKRMMAILLAVAMAVLPAGSSLADVSIGGKEEKKEISVHVATPGNADEKPEEDTELDNEDMRDEAGDENMTDEASGGQVATPSNASLLNMKAAVRGDFEYEVDGDGIRITKYTGTDTDVVIPDEIDGKPVTAIGENAFTTCGMTTIDIPESVTSIGEWAFAFCSNLTSIHIPDGVKQLKLGAYDAEHDSGGVFSECIMLEKISGGNGLELVESGTFSCWSLDKELKFTILDTQNPVLLNHNWESEGRTLSSNEVKTFDNGLQYLETGEYIKIVGYVGTNPELTIPQAINGKAVKAIASFNSDTLTSVVIPEGVTSIGGYFSLGCVNLRDVIIPKSVTKIGSLAFSGCTSLKSISIPNENAVIEREAFRDCKSLTNVELPKNLTSISEQLFQGCSNLENITIPASVTSIGNWAFYDCSGLTNIIIPDKVTSIGQQAFYSCDSLKTISNGSSIKSIGDSCFYWYDYTDYTKQMPTILNTNNNVLKNYDWEGDNRTVTINPWNGGTNGGSDNNNQGSNGSGGGGSSGGGSSHSGGSSSGGGSPRVTSTTTPPDTMSGTWQRNERGWWFTKSDGSYATNEWGRLKGKWYYFGPDGYMQTGWQLINGQWYYLNPSQADEGSMSTGWVLDPATNRWFYLNGDGAMQTGWQNIDGKWYYLNPVSDGTQGTMLTDTWVDGYYVNADGVWTGQQ